MSIVTTLQKNRAHLTRLTTDAVLVALYVVFATALTFKIPNLIEVSLASLPILLAAALFGPFDAAAIALLGSFIEQATSEYGLSPTTPLWMAPVVLQALVAGCVFFLLRYRADGHLRANGALIATVLLCELILTAANTAALYIDGAIWGWSPAALHILLPGRLINGLARAVITALLLHLLIPALYRVLPRSKKQ